jgi:hypothetical protein
MISFCSRFPRAYVPSLKSLRGKDEREASLQLKQREGHNTLKSSAQDAKVKASLQDRPTQASVVEICLTMKSNFIMIFLQISILLFESSI